MKKSNDVDIILNAGTAENKLLHDKIMSKLSHFKFDNSLYLSYSPSIGMFDFRKTMLNIMQLNTKRKLNVDYLGTSSGASSAIINLLTVLCKEGDGIMIPTPCYGSFVSFITDHAKCKFIPVNSFYENNFKLRPNDLEIAYKEAISSGQTISCLIITNPDNPLGKLLTKSDYINYLSFAKKYKLNIIIDEIYSNSIIEGEFISSLDIIDTYFSNNENEIEFFKNHTFIINGPSKDFGMNGFRAGYLYTENRDVFLQFMDKNVRSTPSTYLQSALMYLFNDKEWVLDYIKEYKIMLKQYYKRVTELLDMYKIPYVPAYAGVFLCVDLRKYMKELTFEEESRLSRHMTYNHFLYINPGESMYFKEPGFFRIVYTDKKEYENIIHRLKEALDTYK